MCCPPDPRPRAGQGPRGDPSTRGRGTSPFPRLVPGDVGTSGQRRAGSRGGVGASPHPARLPSRKLYRSWSVILGTSCPNRIPPCPLARRAGSAWDLVLRPPGRTPRGWMQPALGTSVSPPSGCSDCGQLGAASLWSNTSGTKGHAGVPGAVCWWLGLWGMSPPPVLTHTHLVPPGKVISYPPRLPNVTVVLDGAVRSRSPLAIHSSPPQLPGLALPWVPLKWSRELLTAPMGG